MPCARRGARIHNTEPRLSVPERSDVVEVPLEQDPRPRRVLLGQDVVNVGGPWVEVIEHGAIIVREGWLVRGRHMWPFMTANVFFPRRRWAVNLYPYSRRFTIYGGQDATTRCVRSSCTPESRYLSVRVPSM